MSNKKVPQSTTIKGTSQNYPFKSISLLRGFVNLLLDYVENLKINPLNLILFLAVLWELLIIMELKGVV